MEEAAMNAPAALGWEPAVVGDPQACHANAAGATLSPPERPVR